MKNTRSVDADVVADEVSPGEPKPPLSLDIQSISNSTSNATIYVFLATPLEPDHRRVVHDYLSGLPGVLEVTFDEEPSSAILPQRTSVPFE
jgi:hypothetical protein